MVQSISRDVCCSCVCVFMHSHAILGGCLSHQMFLQGWAYDDDDDNDNNDDNVDNNNKGNHKDNHKDNHEKEINNV